MTRMSAETHERCARARVLLFASISKINVQEGRAFQKQKHTLFGHGYGSKYQNRPNDVNIHTSKKACGV